MAQQQLPDAWRKAVCLLLATEDPKKVVWEPLGRTRYEADFHPSWPYEAFASFRNYLKDPAATGCLVVMNHPPGETWEFFFTHKNRKTYGKILLSQDRKRILIFSAHFPLKALLSCER